MTVESHVEDLVAGYLLGALEPDETERVRAHLETCAACGALLAESRKVLAVLPDQLDELAPRAGVRATLLASLETETRASAEPGRAGVSDIAAWRARLRPMRILGAAAAAAAIAAIVALTAWTVALNDRIDERDARLARLTSLVDSVAGSEQVLTMRGTDAAPEVEAALVVPRAGGVVVLASHVPEPARGQGYHLWLFEGNEATYAGLLIPDDNGDVIRAISEVDLTAFDRMEVDVQPLDANTPGGTTVLGGELN